MKTKLFSLLLAAVLCAGNMFAQDVFKADKKYISFNENGGKQQVRIDSDSSWEIYSAPEWATVRKMGNTLTVKCVENISYTDREEDIILVNKEGKKLVIVVAQDKPDDYLIASANVINDADGSGGRYIIHVRSNLQRKASTNADWCRVTTFDGDSMVLSIDENITGKERQCEVEIVAGPKLKKSVFVKQIPMEHYVLVTPQIVTGTKRGGIITIQVKCDSKWRVVNLPEWCEVTDKTNDSFRLNIGPNKTDSPRSAVFSVSASGTRKNVTVKQE
jgi:hypothetical protein